MKAKFLASTLLIFCHAATAASACNPENLDDQLSLIFKPKFECLSKKYQTLINECAAFQKIKIFNNWQIIEPPKSKCDNTSSTACSFSILEKTKYDSNYGAKTNLVVKIYKLEVNRFGEETSKTMACGWNGSDYKIFKINNQE